MRVRSTHSEATLIASASEADGSAAGRSGAARRAVCTPGMVARSPGTLAGVWGSRIHSSLSCMRRQCNLVDPMESTFSMKALSKT